MNTFLLLLDLCTLGLGAYFLYWQAHIDIHASFSMLSAFMAVVVSFWFLSAGINNLPYIIFIAAFITLLVLTGTSGLTPTKVIATGWFQRVIPYQKLVAITLTPVKLPDGRQLVVAIFSLSTRRFVRMSFKTDVESLVTALKARIPKSLPITIQRVDQ